MAEDQTRGQKQAQIADVRIRTIRVALVEVSQPRVELQRNRRKIDETNPWHEVFREEFVHSCGIDSSVTSSRLIGPCEFVRHARGRKVSNRSETHRLDYVNRCAEPGSRLVE